MRKNIDGHIYLYAAFVRKSDCFRHGFLIKIVCFRPKGEGLAADVDRIRAVDDGGLQGVEVARGKQEFGFFHTDVYALLITDPVPYSVFLLRGRLVQLYCAVYDFPNALRLNVENQYGARRQ